MLSEEKREMTRNLLSYHGNAFTHSDLTKYLLHGYGGLSFSVEDVIAEKATKGSSPLFSWYGWKMR